MANAVLVIDQPDSALSYAAGVLTVRSSQNPVWKIGVSQLGLLVVNSLTVADSRVWRGLSQAKVAVAIAGSQRGDEVAWLGTGLGSTGALRHKQHLAYANPEKRLQHARWTLEQKLLAMEGELALGWLGEQPQLRAALHRTRTSLDFARDLAVVDGMEGAVSALWFRTLSTLVDPQWGFQRRTRRPPRDPFNALLSYGYAVANGDALMAVQSPGLDPALGFLHSLYPGRNSLALDALECVRAMVDRMVVQLVRDTLHPHQFQTDAEKGCVLDKEVRSTLIRAWHVLRREQARPRLQSWAFALRQRLGHGNLELLEMEAQ